MSLYTKYQHLLNIPYVEGKDDCYGLFRKFYSGEYGLALRNYARPANIFHDGKNLIGDNFLNEGFEVRDTSFRDLHFGDALLIAIGCKIPNHVAVYVGNGLILHHLYKRPSSVDHLSDAWKQRTLNVLRHPFVTEKNQSNVERIELYDLLPPHVRKRLKVD